MIHSELSPDTSSHEALYPTPRATLAFAKEHKETTRLFYSRGVWYTVIALFVLISIAICIKASHSTATLAIEFNGYSRVFEGEVTDDMTVLDALNISMIAGNIPFQFTDKGDNAEFIILNEADKPPYNIQISLNEQLIDTRHIKLIQVHPHDSIIVKILH